METSEGEPAEHIHRETSPTAQVFENSAEMTAAQPDTAVSYYRNAVDTNEDEPQATTASTNASEAMVDCSGNAVGHDEEERAAAAEDVIQKSVPSTNELSQKSESDPTDGKWTARQDNGEEKASTKPTADAAKDGSGDHKSGYINEETCNQENTLLNNTPRKNHHRSGTKHVEWQIDHDTELNVRAPLTDTGTANPSPSCDNVDPVERTEPLTQSLSCKNNANALDSESLTSESCPSARGYKGPGKLTDTVRCFDDTSHTTESTDVERKENGDVHSTPDLLVKRRPLSANGVWTRSGRFWGDKSLSEESLRPCSAIAPIASATRRYSLPLDSCELVSSQHSQKLCWDDKKDQTSKFPDLHQNSFVAGVEKQTGKAVLVTYRDQEQTKTPDERRDSSLPLKEKPPRPVSSQNAVKACRRPATAKHNQARAAGRRPSSRPSSHHAPSSMAPPRSWEVTFSKEELRCALPRRNFFSCHNKALKDAGFEVEEENERPRRRRLLFFHHEDASDDPPAPLPVVKEPLADEAKENYSGVKNILPENLLETAVGSSKRRKSTPSSTAVVECKPLQQYLTYVRDNPGEYRHMIAKSCSSGAAAALHPSSNPADNCHTARLVRIGRIFQERQLGGLRADEVLRAAYSLNPRSADPNRFASPQRDKSPLIHGLMVSRKQSTHSGFAKKEPSTALGFGEDASKAGQRSKPGSEDRQKQEAERAAVEQLTEVEKRKLKAEEWTRTVTTEQLVRAKLHVLKELGHEERELSQWWLAFRDCFYLRPRIRE